MTGWTTVEMVRARYEGQITTAQEPVIATWLLDAERQLVSRVPELDARITSGALDVGDVQRVVAMAVIRYLRNPGGVTQRSVAEGSFNQSTSYASGSTSTGITFTEDELAALRPSGAPAGFGIVYTRPTRRWGGPDWPHDHHHREIGAEW